MEEAPPLLMDRHDDGVVVLTINRPEVRNAISGPGVMEALLAALEDCTVDRSIRAIVLTGAGTVFCAGGNLKTMSSTEARPARRPVDMREHYRATIHRIALAFERSDIPVIAAINGPALGAGCDLACMCDLRVAGRSARFAESFVKIGLISGDGGAWLLPRVVGFAKASEMALTGDPIDAEEAYRCGLVSRVVDDGLVLDAALDLARRIAANPPVAVRMTRRLLREAQGARLESVLEMSAALQVIAHATEDHNAAIAAVIERRDGVYHGR